MGVRSRAAIARQKETGQTFALPRSLARARATLRTSHGLSTRVVLRAVATILRYRDRPAWTVMQPSALGSPPAAVGVEQFPSGTRPTWPADNR